MTDPYYALAFLSCTHCIAGQVAATADGPKVPRIYAPSSPGADPEGLVPLCFLIRETSPRACRVNMLADVLAAGRITLCLQAAAPAPTQLYIPEPAWNELQP